ncbi:MAG: hypothetical protein Q8K32_31045 [Archangium sp.]|nr:hypothetical protein [Archangium sp.]
MFVIYGVRTYGAVDHEDGSQHATRFVHVYYLPLIPMGGVRVAPDGLEQPASMGLKSVSLAYARFWGFALAAGLSFHAYFELEKHLASGLMWTAVAGLTLLAVLGSWFWAGVRRPHTPLSIGLGCIPVVVLALMTGSAIKENVSRQASKFVFDPKGGPSPELLAFAEEQAKLEQKSRLEKQQARCDSGEGEMCNEVGYALAKTDRVASLAAYEKGCQANYGMSCFNLALKTEPEKSVPLYERSCELGYGDGCNNLATGFEKNDRKHAVELFDKACKLESKLGCKNLARLKVAGKKKG